MVRRGLTALVAVALLACNGTPAPIPQVNDAAPQTHKVGAAIPPYGPAGGALTGSYPNPGVNFAKISTDGGLDGGVLTNQAGIPTFEAFSVPVIAIDAGTKNQLPEARLVNCGTTGQVVTFNGSAMVCGTVATSGVTPGTSGQIYQTNATPAATWNTESGDCTISATGVQTCTQLQSGEIVAGATSGTLTCAAGATACGEVQASTAGATGASLTFTAQQSTNASPTGGNIVNVLQGGSPTAEAYWQVKRGSTVYASIGGWTGAPASYGGLYFGPSVVPGAANYTLLTDGASAMILNTFAGGSLYLSVGGTSAGGGTTAVVANAAGLQMFNAGLTDFGGGTGVLGLGVASAIPTTSPSTAGNEDIFSSTSGTNALHFTNHSDTNTNSSAIGWDSTLSGDALWLGTSTWTDANFQIASNGSTATVLNTTQQGAFEVGGGSGTHAGGWTAQGLIVGNPGTVQATGAGVLQFAPETSLPTLCSTSLAACIYDNSNTSGQSGLVSIDNVGMRTTLAPQMKALTGTGTSGLDVHVLSDGSWIGIGKTVNAQTQIATFPIALGVCEVDWTCLGRITVAGTGTTLGTGLEVRTIDTVQNISGTVTTNGAGTANALINRNPYSSVGPITCVGTYGSSSLIVTATDAGSNGTTDWTIRAKILCD